MSKNAICLWCDDATQEAAEFYARTFPDSAVTAIDPPPIIRSRYMFGSIFNSRSSSSSSSSDDAKGLLAAGAVFVLGVLAVGTAVVSYKSMKANFGD